MASLPAWAQAPQESPAPYNPAALKQLSLEQLSQIEVTSVTKEATSAFRTPGAISILTQADIAQSGARNIPDLLRLVPGVAVAELDSSEWAVGIRGFQGKLSRSVLVLIDGRSVYTPLFAGVYWEMQNVHLKDVERIEVIRGPGGIIWGSNAVNGVINIITKSSRDTHGTLVSVGGGTLEQGFLSWRYGAGDDKFSYRVYGNAFTRGPEYHSDRRNFDDWRMGQAGFRIDTQLTNRDTFTFQGDTYTAEAGQKLAISSFSPPSIAQIEADKLFNGQNLMAAWQRVFPSGSDLQIRAYWDRTHREELNYGEVRNTFDVDLIHHVTVPRNDLTWGLGVRFSPSTFSQKVTTVDFTPHQQNYNIFSAFLQDEISIRPDRLTLTIGSKFEHTSYSGFNYQPEARLAWTPDRRHTFWTAITRAVRTASRVEDGFNYNFFLQPVPPLYIRLIGDGGFTQEQLIGYEAGFRKYFSTRGFVSLSLFHNRYDDVLSVENRPTAVETTPDPPHLVLPLFFRNGLAANSSGGEIAALWDLKEWWRVRASYSMIHLDAKHQPNSNDASTIGQLEGETPMNKAVLQSFFTLPHRLDLNLVYRYVSDVPNMKISSYSTGDLTLARHLGNHLTLEISGRNLLQPYHFEYAGPPGPLVGIRRSGWIGLVWTR